MAYAVIADVQGLMAQHTLTATSKPTLTQATAITNDTSDEIDARLAAVGVVTPVTTPASFLRALALLNAYGAAAAILKSMFPDAVGPGDTPAYAFWEKRYQDGLDAISAGADGGVIPPAVPDSLEAVRPSTYFTRNPDEEEFLGDIAEPMFKKGDEF